MKTDPIVDQVIDKFKQRSELGIKKYGTTLAENDKDDFLNHLQEELMDAILYIQKLKSPSLIREETGFRVYVLKVINSLSKEQLILLDRDWFKPGDTLYFNRMPVKITSKKECPDSFSDIGTLYTIDRLLHLRPGDFLIIDK